MIRVPPETHKAYGQSPNQSTDPPTDLSSAHQRTLFGRPPNEPKRNWMRALGWTIWNYRQRRFRTGWRLLLQLVLLMVVAAPLVFWAIAILNALQVDALDDRFQVGLGLAQATALIVSVCLASGLFDRRRQSWTFGDLGIQGFRWSDFGFGFGMGALAVLGIFLIETGLGWVEVCSFGLIANRGWQQMVSTQLSWLILMIAVAVSEELLSRGYQLKNLSEGLRGLDRLPGPRWHWSVLVAIVITSLFFGLLHISNDHAGLLSTLGVCTAGIMLAIGRIVTGSLAAPIGLHLSWNWFQGPVFGFAVSGHTISGSLFTLRPSAEPWHVFLGGGAFGPEAGLLGLFVVVLLAFSFLFWPRFRGRLSRHSAQLAHYRAPVC